MDRTAPAKRKPYDPNEPPRVYPEHVGYLMRWHWSPPARQGDASLRETFINQLLWWNFSHSHRPLDLIHFRRAMLPYEEWVLDDDSVVMLGCDCEPWLRRLPDGTIQCHDAVTFDEIYGNPTASFDEHCYKWVVTKEERQYYDKNTQDEATMREAAEDALRAWGMPVMDIEKHTAWANRSVDTDRAPAEGRY